MAVTAVTPTQLVPGTVSNDILDSDGVVADTVSDGWAIALGARGKTQGLLIRLVADGTGDTAVVTAGDNPPAMLAAKGALSITLAASDARWIVLEPGRHEQNDNTIVITCGDTGTKLLALLMPYGFGGGSGVA